MTSVVPVHSTHKAATRGWLSRSALSKTFVGAHFSATRIRGHRTACFFKAFWDKVQPSGDEHCLLKVGYNLEFLTGLGYRVSPACLAPPLIVWASARIFAKLRAAKASRISLIRASVQVGY